MDRRALPTLSCGLAGLSLGTIAAVGGSPVLAVAAGASALLASVSGLYTLRSLQTVERREPSRLEKISDYLPPPGTPTMAELEIARSVVDPATGLPDSRYFDLVVESRVAAARRHLWPVTIVLLELAIDPSRSDRHHVLTDFTSLMRRTLREADIACRLGEATFGLVLENTAEEGGVWTAERLQIGLAKDNAPVRRLAAGVASYPIHGLRSGEVLQRAQGALTRACAAEAGHGLGQVEVAGSDLV